MRKMDDMETRDPMFAAMFDPLRSEMDTLDAPPGVEKELMQAFARQFPRKRRWYQALPARPWALGGSLAAGVLAVTLTLSALMGPPPARTGVPADGNAAPLTRGDDGGLFIALDSLERIEQEPAPRMVETEVPRSSLAALGVPLTPDNAGDAVKAELLVASDGQPLALRLSAVN